jgi:hypothetical protein
MLPTIICFIDGVAADRIVGFDELGGTDDFPTFNLSKRLMRSGVIIPKTNQEKGRINIKKGAKKRNNNESDSDSGNDSN